MSLETACFPMAPNGVLNPMINCEISMFNIVPTADRRGITTMNNYSIFRFRIMHTFPKEGDYEFNVDYIEALRATALKSNLSMNMMTIS